MEIYNRSQHYVTLSGNIDVPYGLKIKKLEWEDGVEVIFSLLIKTKKRAKKG